MNKIKNNTSLLKSSISNYNTIFSEFVKEMVCAYYEVDYTRIASISRKKEVIKCRQIAIYLIRKHTNLSISAIGRLFNKNHATILHSVKTITNYLEWDKDLSKELDEVEKIVILKSGTMIHNFSIDKNLYFIDMNDFVSFKVDEKKSIILVGYTFKDITQFSLKNSLDNFPRVHKNKAMYILEKNEPDEKETN